VSSPFAMKFRELRYQRGMRQHELADRMGFKRSYVSALENDLKNAPTEEFLEAACSALQLSESEANALRQAHLASQRRYAVPEDVSPETFEFIAELFARLDTLNAEGVKALRQMLTALSTRAEARPRPAMTLGRVRRRDRGLCKEGAM
jgi:transcriptional regulator with XRE-family HTH domain